MTSTLRRAAVVCAALLALTACGESAVEPSGGGADPGGDTLVFASIPSEESTSLQQNYAAVLAMLERETGTTIEFQNATDYAAVIEGQRAGKIDLASYGPFSYIIAKDGGVPIEPLAAPVNVPGDAPRLHVPGLRQGRLGNHLPRLGQGQEGLLRRRRLDLRFPGAHQGLDGRRPRHQGRYHACHGRRPVLGR